VGWFKKVIEEIPAVTWVWRIGNHNPQAPLWAHGDGCALQLFGAFDAFSCGIAHHLGLPRADEASFAGLGNGIPSQHIGLARSVRAIVEAEEWKELADLRHRAAHRGVLGQYLWSGPASSERDATAGGPYVTRVYLDPRTVELETRREALPVLWKIVSWAEGPLRWLWNLGETWRQPHEPSVIGTLADLDVAGIPIPPGGATD
jgi:hypothetical protein